jgi:hypothetical protein
MKYTYVTCCVDCPDVPALSNMIDIAMGITYATAAKYIDMQKTNRMLGYNWKYSSKPNNNREVT